MTPIETLLPRLEKVHQRAPNSWMARCPAHNDTRPSLSITTRESDGAVLLKCFASCDVHSVVAALNLQLSDLFPSREGGSPERFTRPAPPWREVIAFLREDLQVVQIGAARLSAGDELSESDLDRLGLAALRIYEVLKRA